MQPLGDLGAVGLNLEDSDPATGDLVDPAEQAVHFLAFCDPCAAAGTELVINARIDAFLRKAQIGSPEV